MAKRQASGKKERKVSQLGVRLMRPVAEMVNKELDGAEWGGLARFVHDCIVETVGHKYPEQRERYRILREEKTAV